MDLRRLASRNAITSAGALRVAAAASLWGTTGTFAALFPQVTAGQMAALRLLGGIAVLWVIAAATRQDRRPLDPAVRRLVLAAGVAAGVFQPAFFAAVQRCGVAAATLVALGTAPMFTGVLQWVGQRTRPRGRWALATGVAVLGLGLLVRDDVQAADVAWAGLGLAALSGFLYAVYTTATARAAASGAGSSTVVRRSLAVAAALCAPLLLSGAATLPPAGPAIAALVWLGAVTTALAYRLFVTGAVVTGPATAATLGLLEPVVALVLAWVLLGEMLTLTSAAGAALIMVSVVYAALAARQSDPGAPRDVTRYAAGRT